MIGRALVGAALAALAMFIFGFVFFATPLNHLAFKSLPDAQAASVQTVLAQNMPGTGTYAVPSDSTAQQTILYGRGPIATVHYNTNGFAVGGTSTMVGRLVHLFVVALLMAAGLGALSRYVPNFGEQVRLLVLGVVGAAVFMRLGEPIWFHHDWGQAIYRFVADCISLILAGLIILKLLPQARSAAPAEAPTEV